MQLDFLLQLYEIFNVRKRFRIKSSKKPFKDKTILLNVMFQWWYSNMNLVFEDNKGYRVQLQGFSSFKYILYNMSFRENKPWGIFYHPKEQYILSLNFQNTINRPWALQKYYFCAFVWLLSEVLFCSLMTENDSKKYFFQMLAQWNVSVNFFFVYINLHRKQFKYIAFYYTFVMYSI